MSKLTKPQFVKVKTLVDSRNGYNVYVKVVKAELAKSNDGLTTFVRAVVADQTGAANAFFKGESANLIKEGAVIAIRNGKIRLIKNHISLEIDIFGRVTPQTVQIKQNSAENISEKEVQRRKTQRRDYDREDRHQRPRRGDQQRPRRPRQDRQPREHRQLREPREHRQPRQHRQPREHREPREQQHREPREQREPRQHRQPRQHREPREHRQPREHREPREQRQPRDNNRQPRQGGERNPRGQEGERRPPINWTKIAGLDPGDEGLNIIAKVISVENVGKRARVVLGDETGIVKAFLYQNDALKEGNTIVLFKAESAVVKQHIQVQLMERGKVDLARREIKDVNKSHDVSAKEWVEQS